MKEQYRVRFPFIPDMGTVGSIIVSDKPMESKEEEALWHLNKSREHDGLAPRKHLPLGTSFEIIY